MALDAAIGGASSNSYATLEEANAYFLTTYNRSLWTPISDPGKESCLIEATRQIDALYDWIGIINTTEQALAWPRKVYAGTNVDNYKFSDFGNGYEFDKNPCDGVSIPRDVKYAVYELAYVILQSGFSLSDDNIDEIKLASLGIKFSKTIKSDSLPKIVMELLRKYGWCRVAAPNSIGVSKLVRA